MTCQHLGLTRGITVLAPCDCVAAGVIDISLFNCLLFFFSPKKEGAWPHQWAEGYNGRRGTRPPTRKMKHPSAGQEETEVNPRVLGAPVGGQPLSKVGAECPQVPELGGQALLTQETAEWN